MKKQSKGEAKRRSGAKRKLEEDEEESSSATAKVAVEEAEEEDTAIRRHFERELSEEDARSLTDGKAFHKRPVEGGDWAGPESGPPSGLGLSQLPPFLRKNLRGAWGDGRDGEWEAMAAYADVCQPNRAAESEETVEKVCAHVLGHALRTRSRVLRDSARLERLKTSGATAEERERAVEECRDQGLVRPKTLILLPFRSSALRYVETITRLLFKSQAKESVDNKKRFLDEFAVDGGAVGADKPQDHQRLFDGNTDDCFRIGLGLSKKSLKLFENFYSADILIASPLGLRMAIGAEGEEDYEFDFLASIQLLVLDQADVFLMQNWSHVLHVLEHLHRQPREPRGVELARVRHWELDGRGRLYRQTLLFAQRLTPELSSVHSRFCANHAGLLRLAPKLRPTGLVSALPASLAVSQTFRRFPSPPTAEAEAEARFAFFTASVLPSYVDAGLKGTAIYVPSYLDFVRLRNHLKREGLGAVQISEYTKPVKVSRARDMFFHGEKPFLLYSERAHFYHRHHVRGIRQLLFYQLPLWSEFYAETVELVGETAEAGEGGAASVVALFSQRDALRLAPLLGPQLAKRLLTANQTTHTLASLS